MISKYKYLIQKGIFSLKQSGFRKTILKVFRYFVMKKNIKNYASMQENLLAISEPETCINEGIKFSILVPLYNTPGNFLAEMIESVQKQSYSNWELCLADGSDEANLIVMEICLRFSKEDARIKYQKLEKNLGISGNSNECLKIVTGDYITLFDHDDLLHPEALYEVAKAIAERNADFIYTDEAVFVDNLKNIISVHRKPDYAPDNLRANNYICHLTTFSKSLLEQTDAFRSKYDGSQDHDLILRLTGIANNIVHIPKILYFWRSHAASVAFGIGAKSYAVKAGQNAVRDYLESIGQPCSVESLDFCPTIYRIKYKLLSHPLVSIILKVDKLKDIEHYIANVIFKNNYTNCDYYFLCKDEELVVESENKLKGICVHRAILRDNTISYIKYLNAIVDNEARGAYLVFMDRWLTPLSNDWLGELLMYAQRLDVGLVGSKVYYKNGMVKSAAVAFEERNNKKKIRFLYKFYDKNAQGYMGKLQYAQNVDAIMSDCIMVRRDCFCDVNGFGTVFKRKQDSIIDFCIKINNAGYLVVWNPYADFVR